MAHMRQQHQDSAEDALDEHGQQQQEGEEAGAPLVVDHHHNDQHHRKEHHDSEVDVLALHAAADTSSAVNKVVEE